MEYPWLPVENLFSKPITNFLNIISSTSWNLKTLDLVFISTHVCILNALIYEFRFVSRKPEGCGYQNYQLCQIYGRTAMSDSAIIKWCDKCRNRRTNEHKEGWKIWLLIFSEILFTKLISGLSTNFPQMFRITLYGINIVTDDLGFIITRGNGYLSSQ